MESNPALSVKGPRYSIKKGLTPVLENEEARELLDSIDASTLVGLRDRAVIAFLTYTFARVSAAVNVKVEDLHRAGRRWRVRLFEKNGTVIDMDCHHNLRSTFSRISTPQASGKRRDVRSFGVRPEKNGLVTERRCIETTCSG